MKFIYSSVVSNSLAKDYQLYFQMLSLFKRCTKNLHLLPWAVKTMVPSIYKRPHPFKHSKIIRFSNNRSELMDNFSYTDYFSILILEKNVFTPIILIAKCSKLMALSVASLDKTKHLKIRVLIVVLKSSKEKIWRKCLKICIPFKKQVWELGSFGLGSLAVPWYGVIWRHF